MDHFRDRLAAARYAQDEPVTVSAAGREHDVPERLFSRVQQIASAYELHLLPALDMYTQTTLDPRQCTTLAEELAFVEGRVDDPLLAKHVGAIREMAAQCARNSVTLVIEGP